jgi:hypothetical protein
MFESWNRGRRAKRDIRSTQKRRVFLLKQRQGKELSRLGYYHDGFNARMAGRPCKPPGRPPIERWYPEDEPYYVMRADAWSEGWEVADREETEKAMPMAERQAARESRNAALQKCRTAHAAELKTQGYRDGLIEAARRAGATMEEIAAAFDART